MIWHTFRWQFHGTPLCQLFGETVQHQLPRRPALSWFLPAICDVVGSLALNPTANHPGTASNVISRSRSTSPCNQLCGEGAQRIYAVGNEYACRVYVFNSFPSRYPFSFCNCEPHRASTPVTVLQKKSCIARFFMREQKVFSPFVFHCGYSGLCSYICLKVLKAFQNWDPIIKLAPPSSWHHQTKNVFHHVLVVIISLNVDMYIYIENGPVDTSCSMQCAHCDRVLYKESPWQLLKNCRGHRFNHELLKLHWLHKVTRWWGTMTAVLYLRHLPSILLISLTRIVQHYVK